MGAVGAPAIWTAHRQVRIACPREAFVPRGGGAFWGSARRGSGLLAPFCTVRSSGCGRRRPIGRPRGQAFEVERRAPGVPSGPRGGAWWQAWWISYDDTFASTVHAKRTCCTLWVLQMMQRARQCTLQSRFSRGVLPLRGALRHFRRFGTRSQPPREDTCPVLAAGWRLVAAALGAFAPMRHALRLNVHGKRRSVPLVERNGHHGRRNGRRVARSSTRIASRLTTNV